jgi:hypothetical protein
LLGPLCKQNCDGLDKVDLHKHGREREGGKAITVSMHAGPQQIASVQQVRSEVGAAHAVQLMIAEVKHAAMGHSYRCEVT